jgi:hypothetical protein
MQHWRAVIEYEKGATISSMVAPSTATLSVIHNRTFAWAYGGMPYFGYEVFKQETTNAVMAAILMHGAPPPATPCYTPLRPVTLTKFSLPSHAVHCARGRSCLVDVLNPKSPKNPANRAAAGVHSALELFKTESVHGGLWRSPYKVDSIGEVSALIYFAGEVRLFAKAKKKCVRMRCFSCSQPLCVLVVQTGARVRGAAGVGGRGCGVRAEAGAHSAVRRRRRHVVVWPWRNDARQADGPRGHRERGG